MTDQTISGLLRKQGQTDGPLDAIVVAEVEPLSLQPKKYQGRPLGYHIRDALRKEERGLPPTLFPEGSEKRVQEYPYKFLCLYRIGIRGV